MTDANRLRLTTVREVTFGTTPASPKMRTARITGESLQYAPQFVSSSEIRNDRMASDPIKTNETNQGAINFELSYPVQEGALADFFRSALFNAWSNTPTFDNDGTADSVITDAGTVGSTFAVVSGGTTVKAGHLVRATGFANAANNLIFRVQSSTGTTIGSTGLSLSAETAPAATARLKVIGFQGVSGDITATSTGLASTSLDFTTLGLSVGQWINIGGTASVDRFATAANNDFARITAIAADALTLDNRPVGWTTDAGTGKAIKVWFGDKIINGVTQTSMTIERGFMGQTTPTYIVQRGMMVSQMALNFADQAVINGSFNFMGLSGAQSTTSLSDTPVAETSNAIMSSNVNVGRIAESGTAVLSPNFIRSATISINNNLRQNTAVGIVGAADIGVGECSVTGTLETYFGSNSLYAKLLAGTIGSINLRASKNNQALVFQLPRVTFTEGSPSASAKNTDVTLPLGFMASKDPTMACHIQIDRFEYMES